MFETLGKKTEYIAKKYLLMSLLDRGYSIDANLLKGALFKGEKGDDRLILVYSDNELKHFEDQGMIEKDERYNNITAYRPGPQIKENWNQDEINNAWADFDPIERSELNRLAKIVEIYKTTERNELLGYSKDSYGFLVELPLLRPKHSKFINLGYVTIINLNIEDEFGLVFHDLHSMSEETQKELTYQHIISNISDKCAQMIIDDKISSIDSHLADVKEKAEKIDSMDLLKEYSSKDAYASTYDNLADELETTYESVRDLQDILIRMDANDKQIKTHDIPEKTEYLEVEIILRAEMNNASSRLPSWFKSCMQKIDTNINESLKLFCDSSVSDKDNEEVSRAISLNKEQIKDILEKDFIAFKTQEIIETLSAVSEKKKNRTKKQFLREYVLNLFDKDILRFNLDFELQFEVTSGKRYIDGIIDFLQKNNIEFMNGIPSGVEHKIREKYPVFNTIEALEGCSFKIPAGKCGSVLKFAGGGNYSSQCDMGYDDFSAKILFPHTNEGIGPCISPINNNTVKLPLDEFVAVCSIYDDLLQEEVPEDTKKLIPAEPLDLFEHLTIADGIMIIEPLEIGKDYHLSLENMYSILNNFVDSIDNLEDIKDSIMPLPEEK
ncbi:MAG: hypothetical protein KAS11_00860 [Candidatus Aenigmarchaeota archaeon]|nr:hypothetical protein [Candidatus Aenigmarchaeota archaeon]